MLRRMGLAIALSLCAGAAVAADQQASRLEFICHGVTTARGAGAQGTGRHEAFDIDIHIDLSKHTVCFGPCEDSFDVSIAAVSQLKYECSLDSPPHPYCWAEFHVPGNQAEPPMVTFERSSFVIDLRSRRFHSEASGVYGDPGVTDVEFVVQDASCRRR